jgi:hypothetical protein
MNRETRSILTSTMAGVIIGWVVGVAQLIYIGSWELIYWAFMPLIPIYSALGGGLYGMIFGGGGLFAEKESSVVEETIAPVGHGHAA